MVDDRVNIPVHEYLHNEGHSMDTLDSYLAKGIVSNHEALRELVQSYRNVLFILSQQQYQRDITP